MKTFLIDLENVKNQGFTGIDKLAAEDRVFVFYSDGANTLNIPTIQLINRSACSVEYVPLQRSGHNAMDFQIVGLLGFLIGSEKQGYFGIISQDQGYLAPVEFFMDHSADVLDIHVLVTPNILTAVRKWDAQEQNSRKVLTSGKKNEKNLSSRSAAEVIDVEVVPKQSTEEESIVEVTEEIKVNADVMDEAIVVEEEEITAVENTEAVVEEAGSSIQEEEASEKEEVEVTKSSAEESIVENKEVQTEEKTIETVVEEAGTVEADQAETAEPVGVYVEEISNAFVGAIVDSADSTSSDEEISEENTEKKNTRSSRNKKKKTVKKSTENASKAETEKNAKTVKTEETAPAEKKEKTKTEKKQDKVKADSKNAERPEKKKEPRKNSKKASEVAVDPQDIQKVHALIGDKLDEEQLQFEGEIVKAVIVSDGKNHFYQYFNHTLGREKGGNLYHAIRNDYEKLVKALK